MKETLEDNSESPPLSVPAATVGAAKPGKDDLTGMDRMAWNVVTSWGGHLVFVIAGFIMPRLMDRHVGQTALGIWDFSWSLVSYFGLAGLGVGTSVNRHVAMYRAAGDIEKMRRAVSSVVAVQASIAATVLILTAAAVPLTRFFLERHGADLVLAQWVVGLLGCSLAVQMGFDAFRGVVTGCHRWDVHNALNAAAHTLTIAFMMITLISGGGLREVAAVYLVFTLATELTRVAVAHRVCPELLIRVRYMTWREARSMLAFGGSSMVAGLTPLVLGQATNLMVAHHLGPAALAVFSRPTALVRSVQTFINKFAYVLTPMAGSLQGTGRSDEIRKLALQTTRIGVALSLPMILLLAIDGDIVLRLWMGVRYDQGAVLAIMAFGSFLPMTQQSVWTILMGLNLHGRTGSITLLLGLVSLGVGIVIVNHTGWNLQSAALLVAVPLTIANGVVVPWYACRQLEIRLRSYFRRVFVLPILCCVPFAAALYLARFIFVDSPARVLFLGTAMGALILGPLYYKFILPQQVRVKLKNFISGNSMLNLFGRAKRPLP